MIHDLMCFVLVNMLSICAKSMIVLFYDQSLARVASLGLVIFIFLVRCRQRWSRSSLRSLKTTPREGEVDLEVAVEVAVEAILPCG